jgi:hypothetical protein
VTVAVLAVVLTVFRHIVVIAADTLNARRVDMAGTGVAGVVLLLLLSHVGKPIGRIA